MQRSDRVADWNDGVGNEWREELPTAVTKATNIGLEPDQMPPLVRAYINELRRRDKLNDITPLLSAMR